MTGTINTWYTARFPDRAIEPRQNTLTMEEIDQQRRAAEEAISRYKVRLAEHERKIKERRTLVDEGRKRVVEAGGYAGDYDSWINSFGLRDDIGGIKGAIKYAMDLAEERKILAETKVYFDKLLAEIQSAGTLPSLEDFIVRIPGNTALFTKVDEKVNDMSFGGRICNCCGTTTNNGRDPTQEKMIFFKWYKKGEKKVHKFEGASSLLLEDDEGDFELTWVDA